MNRLIVTQAMCGKEGVDLRKIHKFPIRQLNWTDQRVSVPQELLDYTLPFKFIYTNQTLQKAV